MARAAIEEKITRLIEESVKSLLCSTSDNNQGDFFSIPVSIDIPKDKDHGDVTTNIALRLTRTLKKAPAAIAGQLRDLMHEALTEHAVAPYIEKIDAVEPGFINIWFSKRYLYDTLLRIKKEGGTYGSSTAGKHKKVQIEFVSANPTGPLTIAHGRQAAIGDALARILTFYGYKVTKEYFVNDEGNQINTLGESILYHYLSFYGINIDFPEDGYKGEYIKDIAAQIKQRYRDKLSRDYTGNKKFFSDYGIRYILKMIVSDLNNFGVRFDTWFSQHTLTKEVVNAVLDDLRKDGYIFDCDGATWFKSTLLGDEKDRVVIKSDGAYTYFAPDIAYHRIKFKKGFKRVINIWGPDHHGYVPRIKAAVKAMGYSEDAISVLLVQLATLYRDGKALSMSTRRGEFITLREVVDEVGKDVAKFFFLMRKLDSHLDFDLEVAKRQSTDNPVYYIQYAHARIWSILGYSSRIKKNLAPLRLDLDLLKEKEELELCRVLAQFPAYVHNGARNLEPYYIILYLNSLAAMFHNFYTKHRVVTEDLSLSKARLFLVDCIRICLANGLRLLGISLPKKM